MNSTTASPQGASVRTAPAAIGVSVKRSGARISGVGHCPRFVRIVEVVAQIFAKIVCAALYDQRKLRSVFGKTFIPVSGEVGYEQRLQQFIIEESAEVEGGAF